MTVNQFFRFTSRTTKTFFHFCLQFNCKRQERLSRLQADGFCIHLQRFLLLGLLEKEREENRKIYEMGFFKKQSQNTFKKRMNQCSSLLISYSLSQNHVQSTFWYCRNRTRHESCSKTPSKQTANPKTVPSHFQKTLSAIIQSKESGIFQIMGKDGCGASKPKRMEKGEEEYETGASQILLSVCVGVSLERSQYRQSRNLIIQQYLQQIAKFLIILFCLHMQSATQALQAFPTHQQDVSAKKRRIIRKSQKRQVLKKSLRRGYSFCKVKIGSKAQLRTKPLETHSGTDYAILSSIYMRWVEPNPNILKLAISSLLQRFPILPSIDELFSLSSQISLAPNHHLQHLLRYAKICSLLDSKDFQPILLQSQTQAALAMIKRGQPEQHFQVLGLLLSKIECGFTEKRQIFMEKLRNNELKYDGRLGRMSEISKELAFSYRAYIELRNQISATLNHFSSISPSLQGQLEQANFGYARLLLNKNLKHTFEDCSLDHLNYFQLREYIESDRVEDFQSFANLQQFQTFMKKRRPKRVYKHALATACSVCLSDYHQINNCLRHCQGCGLRAHRLCFPFESKRCGYCTYQKLERQVKQQVEWCVICRKAGLMVIKIDDVHYAHGFCLLVHGFWTLKANSNHEALEPETSNPPSKQQQRQSPEHGNSNLQMEIEFSTPTQSGILQSNYQKNQPQFCGQEQSMDILEPRFPNFHVFNSKPQKWEKQLYENTHINECNICGLAIFHNLSLACGCCRKQYHCLCAFLAGFKLSLQDGQFKGGEGNLPTLDCCSGDYCKIGWNRRFKLNYQRCAFESTGQEFGVKMDTGLWFDDTHHNLLS